MKRYHKLWLIIMVLLLAGCVAESSEQIENTPEYQAGYEQAQTDMENDAIEHPVSAAEAFPEEMDQAYSNGWDDCLHNGDIGDFDAYQHDNLMEYVSDYHLDEFVSDNVDSIVRHLEINYPDAVIAAAARIMEEVPPDIPDTGPNYVANTNTKKFHKPDCSSVNDIKSKNRKDWYGSREELIDEGYVPCKKCNP